MNDAMVSINPDLDETVLDDSDYLVMEQIDNDLDDPDAKQSKARLIRSLREVQACNNINKQAMQVVLNKLNTRHKSAALLLECFFDLMAVDNELRVLLVTLISFPISEKKTKLSQDIEQQRSLIMSTQCRVQAILSIVAANDVKKQSKPYSGLFDIFKLVANKILSTTDGFTSITRYGFDGTTEFLYTQCHPISVNLYRPSVCFSLVCSPIADYKGEYHIGISTSKGIYGHGMSSCLLGYKCDMLDKDIMFQICLSVLMNAGYLSPSWNKLYYLPIQSMIANNKTNMQCSNRKILFNNTSSDSVSASKLLLFITRILALSKHRSEKLRQYVTVNDNSMSINIMDYLQDDLHGLPNHVQKHVINLLRLRLLFLAKSFSESNMPSFMTKADKMLCSAFT